MVPMNPAGVHGQPPGSPTRGNKHKQATTTVTYRNKLIGFCA